VVAGAARGVAAWGSEASGRIGAAGIMSELRSRLAARFAQDGGAALCLLELEPQGEIASEQLQADSHPVGMPVSRHEMIQVLPVD
jgi:hypothetical protein